MKVLIKIFALIIFQISSIYGGGGPPPPLPFESAKISGPIYRAPLFLSDSNKVTITTNVSFYSPLSLIGNIDVEGTTNISTSYQDGKDLIWNLSTLAFEMGLDIKVWENTSVFSSLNIDNGEQGINLRGIDFGFGFFSSSNYSLRFRLDLGLGYSSQNAKARLRYISHNSSYPDTVYRVNTDNVANLDPFAALTLNTANENWLINPFFQVSYCSQTIFNIGGYSRDVYSNIHVFTLTPGITYLINKNILLIVGGNFIIPSNIKERSSSSVFSGFTQFNFLL